MLIIISGNIVALIASVLMVYSGYLKEKKKILYIQTIQIGLFIISNLILGGFTGAIINAISCIRNILCYKDKLNTYFKILLIFLSVSLSLIFNNLGFIGFLPLISTVAYILLMDTKKIVSFKSLVVFTLVMWLIYDIGIKSYTSACFDFMGIITNLVSIIQLKKKKDNIIF